ncbi:hypothetical protein BaRGS_00006232, partial [Batillaria attramentaria]
MAGLLAGRLAFVTGGGSGIGRAVCQALAKEGAAVAVADINRKQAEETLAMLDKNITSRAYELDVSSSGSVNTALGAICKDFSVTPCITVNAAGITRDNFMTKLDEKSFDEVINVNLKGTFLVNQAVGKAIAEAKLPSASIVNISSIVGKTGNIGQANYAASKSGVIGLTKTAAKEFARFNTRVNVILPGFIETPMTKTVPEKLIGMVVYVTPLQRMGKPEEIADACVFLASDKSSFITGAVLEVTEGHIVQRGTSSRGAHHPEGHIVQRGTSSRGAHRPEGHIIQRGTSSRGAHRPAGHIVQRAHRPEGHIVQRGTSSRGHIVQRGTSSRGAHRPEGHIVQRGTSSRGAHHPEGHIVQRGTSSRGAHRPEGHIILHGLKSIQMEPANSGQPSDEGTSHKPQLPHGWIVRVSKTYPDRVYYYNTATGVSTWELPGLISETPGGGDTSHPTEVKKRRKRSRSKKSRASSETAEPGTSANVDAESLTSAGQPPPASCEDEQHSAAVFYRAFLSFSSERWGEDSFCCSSTKHESARSDEKSRQAKRKSDHTPTPGKKTEDGVPQKKSRSTSDSKDDRNNQKQTTAVNMNQETAGVKTAPRKRKKKKRKSKTQKEAEVINLTNSTQPSAFCAQPSQQGIQQQTLPTTPGTLPQSRVSLDMQGIPVPGEGLPKHMTKIYGQESADLLHQRISPAFNSSQASPQQNVAIGSFPTGGVGGVLSDTSLTPPPPGFFHQRCSSGKFGGPSARNFDFAHTNSARESAAFVQHDQGQMEVIQDWVNNHDPRSSHQGSRNLLQPGLAQFSASVGDLEMEVDEDDDQIMMD